MSFYGKVYKLTGNENFVDFLVKGHGVPEDKATEIASRPASIKVTKNGDTYTSTNTHGSEVSEATFKSGVEFDDVFGKEKFPVKSTYVVDGNTVTHTVKGPMGTAIFKGEYNGDDLVVTYTSDKFDGNCKIFYKA